MEMSESQSFPLLFSMILMALSLLPKHGDCQILSSSYGFILEIFSLVQGVCL